MAKFREFYVQPGAGSNFLAGKCLWTDNADSREHLEYSRTSTNEFFFDREQINNVWHEIPSEVHKIHEDIFNSKYESKFLTWPFFASISPGPLFSFEIFGCVK